MAPSYPPPILQHRRIQHRKRPSNPFQRLLSSNAAPDSSTSMDLQTRSPLPSRPRNMSLPTPRCPPPAFGSRAIDDNADTDDVYGPDDLEIIMDDDIPQPCSSPIHRRARHMAHMAALATLHAMSQAMLATDIPAYITARSANSIISESRPTRIQAETLSFLNRILDELLLFVVASSKSLATDRIKTDGLLKVFNNNTLAKDAVLEAELELRSYLQNKKAEGGRVPLGLSATSRWDGTEAFPVASAYAALRTRCQYFSTLGDREDDSIGGDQHIMSAEGRPIATITPGVSIYITALLEFIGQYILQNVSRVIERDNSDEASLADLRAAIEEDEAMLTVWRQMLVKKELEKRMITLIASGGSSKRVSRPWQVPDANELYEAARGPASFRPSRNARPGTSQSISLINMDRSSSSASGHGGDNPTSTGRDYASDAQSYASGGHGAGPIANASGIRNSQELPISPQPRAILTRRGSFDKGLSSLFGSKRRASLKGSQDTPWSSSAMSKTSTLDRGASQSSEPVDDFEALVMSDQTMRVSLTPNRLHTIEVDRTEADHKKFRQRPGTLNIAHLRNEVASESDRTSSPLSVPVLKEGIEEGFPKTSSGQQATSLPMSRRSGSRISNPPSSYRGPDGPVAAVLPPSVRTMEEATSASRSGAIKVPPREQSSFQEASESVLNSPRTPSPLGSVQESPTSALSETYRDRSVSRSSSVLQHVDDQQSRSSMGEDSQPSLSRRNGSGVPPSFASPLASKATQQDDLPIRASEDLESEKELIGDPVSDFASSHDHSRSVHSGLSSDARLRQAFREQAGMSGPPSVGKEGWSAPQSGRTQMPEVFASNEGPVPESSDGSPSGKIDEPVMQGRDGERLVSSSYQTSAEETIARRRASDLFTRSRSTSQTTHSHLEESRPGGPPSRKIPYGRRASRDGMFNRLSHRQSTDSTYRSMSNGGEDTSMSARPSTASGLRQSDMDSVSPPLGHPTTARSLSSLVRALVSLEQRMKTCTTVKECQSVVADAVANAVARSYELDGAVSWEDRRASLPVTLQNVPAQPALNDAATSTTPVGSRTPKARPVAASEAVDPQAASIPVPLHLTAPHPVLVMSTSYDEEEDTSSKVHKETQLVAEWLLGDSENWDMELVSLLPGRSPQAAKEASGGMEIPAIIASSSSKVRSDPVSLNIPNSNSTTTTMLSTRRSLDLNRLSTVTTTDSAYLSADEEEDVYPQQQQQRERSATATAVAVAAAVAEIEDESNLLNDDTRYDSDNMKKEISSPGRTTPIPRGGTPLSSIGRVVGGVGGGGGGVGGGGVGGQSNSRGAPPSASRAAIRALQVTREVR